MKEGNFIHPPKRAPNETIRAERHQIRKYHSSFGIRGENQKRPGYPAGYMHGTTGYFDYGAVQFPYGMTDPAKIIFFNRQDVTEKVFMGYINAEERSYEQRFDEVTKSTSYPHLHL
ncbi:DUF4176 domain-containing protein [Bifidobacterium sp. W8106]|uniref:DUF4176 domain-containing protein n=1 Tax=Bifidobacterium TaxID=1678 RepID=UPI0018DC0114|nr:MULTISPECIES: DUF4176 domain-containing protein [Bifidobacterium]MBI0143158.1 DUF4176 domain-containing protein [Bifidobacterium choladohabitans]MBI0147408.1 DUF4176 domain-containing protein [Bifidobacterium sp. W8104]